MTVEDKCKFAETIVENKVFSSVAKFTFTSNDITFVIKFKSLSVFCCLQPVKGIVPSSRLPCLRIHY
jgi:hypothetical protein